MEDVRLNRDVKTWKDFFSGYRETKKIFQWVLTEFTTPKIKYWTKIMIVLSVLTSVLAVVEPYAMRYVFDGLVGKDISQIVLGVVLFFSFFVLGKLIEFGRGVSREYIIGLSIGQQDHRITQLFNEKSIGQHHHNSSTLNIPNIEKGRWKVVDLEAKILFESVHVVLALMLSIVALYLINWIAGVTMTFVLVVHVIWMLYLNKKVMEKMIPVEKEFRKLNKYRFNHWEMVERVKVNGREKIEEDFMQKWYDRLIAQDRSFWIWFDRQASYRSAVNVVGMIGILLLGIWLVWTEVWTIGLLFPLMSWSYKVSSSIDTIGRVEQQINWNIPAVRSMIKALSIKPDIVVREGAKKISEDSDITVAFNQVFYTYPDNDETAAEGDLFDTLKNVSFEILPGEKVALIGPSGAGKTTIMKLLMRFMDPQSGNIFVNGKDLRNIDLKDWMKLVGYIPQRAQIFENTLGYNLSYGLDPNNGSVDEKTIWQIIKRLKIDAGLHLPSGLNTLVGKEGVKLSGGQQQRVMIGAAAIKKPKLMVIDEATSNLDSTTERAVQIGLLQEALKNDVSALIVAHRLSTVRSICSKFVVLANNSEMTNGHPQIEAIAGSFEKLNKISPIFRQLAKDQELRI